jgi:hypothetical protein
MNFSDVCMCAIFAKEKRKNAYKPKIEKQYFQKWIQI